MRTLEQLLFSFSQQSEMIGVLKAVKGAGAPEIVRMETLRKLHRQKIIRLFYGGAKQTVNPFKEENDDERS